jgi:peptidoglycan/xylan/chitin deacetylase (PgdA/CDA1 family)
MMRLSQKLYSILFPKYVWKKKTTKQVVYLTFDDGPIPDVTEWVLNTLNHYNIKATFFCIGDNINKHPDIFERIIKENHQVGNHTFNHLNGWKTHQEK